MNTKAIVMLKCLISAGKLEGICKGLHISYKQCVNIASGLRDPTYDIMRKLNFLIPVVFWFDLASNQFIELMMKQWLSVYK